MVNMMVMVMVGTETLQKAPQVFLHLSFSSVLPALFVVAKGCVSAVEAEHGATFAMCSGNSLIPGAPQVLPKDIRSKQGSKAGQMLA